MSIIRWRPFHELDHFFDDLHSPLNKSGWDLAVDVSEDEESVNVEMHIPGIDPDKIDIEVDDNHLHVSGSRDQVQEASDQQYYRKEIKRGSFERIIPLPSPVDSARARAEFKDGVLKVFLPKDQGKAASKISIEKK